MKGITSLLPDHLKTNTLNKERYQFAKIIQCTFLKIKKQMSKSYSFILNMEEIKLSININQLLNIPEQIRDTLYTTGKYIIKSNIQKQYLEKYLNYIINEKDIPELTRENILDYYLINKEFYFISDFLSKSEFYDDALKYLFLERAIADIREDKSQYEKFISQNLDFYINEYPDILSELSIQSLFNIFNSEERNLNDEYKAYLFIKSQSQKPGKSNLLILLQKLDFSKLAIESFDQSFLNVDQHFNYAPNINISVIRALMKKYNRLYYLNYIFN